MKIHLSFDSDESPFVRRIVAFILSLLPGMRVKRKDGADRRHIYLAGRRIP